VTSDPGRITRLTTVPLFERVSSRELAKIAQILEEVRVGAYETLIREGLEIDTFWILLEGEVDMIIDGKLRRSIGPNGFFGVTSLFDVRPAMATVVTRVPTRAWVVSAARFRSLASSQTARLVSANLERLRKEVLSEG
jgi:CRP-like cAMP-binding protein